MGAKCQRGALTDEDASGISLRQVEGGVVEVHGVLIHPPVGADGTEIELIGFVDRCHGADGVATVTAVVGQHRCLLR